MRWYTNTLHSHPYGRDFGLVCANGAVFFWTVEDACPYKACAEIVVIPFGDRLAKIGAEAMGLSVQTGLFFRTVRSLAT